MSHPCVCLLLALSTALLACGGELPTSSLTGLEETAEERSLNEAPPPPPACVEREGEMMDPNTPWCQAIAPLRLELSVAEPIDVRAGSSLTIPMALLETSGVARMNYPAVATWTDSAGASTDGGVQLYGIFGCGRVDTPIALSVSSGIPPGTEFTVHAEVSALLADRVAGECELAHRRSVRIRVF